MPPNRGAGALLQGMRPCVVARAIAHRSNPHSQTRGLAIAHASGTFQRFRLNPRPFHLPRPARAAQPRFQSTQASATPPDPQSSSLQSPQSGETFGLDPPPSELLSMGDDRHVGFLYENYGIDFGYGTSSMMKYVFEVIHSTGPEFWVSVLVTGFLLRLAISPLNRLVSEESAKMGAMKQITKPLQEKIRNAALDKNMAEMTKLRQQQKQIYKEAGIHPWRVALNLPQVVVGFGCWRTFWHMADKQVDGLDAGGLLWFENLTIPDPYFILPIATSALQYLTFKANMQDSPELSQGQQSLQRVLMYAFPALFLFITSWQPAVIQLHFLTTTSFSGLMASAFRSKAFRSLLRMTPRVNHPPPGTPNGAGKGSVVNAKATSKPTEATPTPPKSASSAAGGSIFTRMREGAADKFSSVRKNIEEGANSVTGNRFSTSVEEKRRQVRRDEARKYEDKAQEQIKKDRQWYERQRHSKRRTR